MGVPQTPCPAGHLTGGIVSPPGADVVLNLQMGELSPRGLGCLSPGCQHVKPQFKRGMAGFNVSASPLRVSCLLGLQLRLYVECT